MAAMHAKTKQLVQSVLKVLAEPEHHKARATIYSLLLERKFGLKEKSGSKAPVVEDIQAAIAQLFDRFIWRKDETTRPGRESCPLENYLTKAKTQIQTWKEMIATCRNNAEVKALQNKISSLKHRLVNKEFEQDE